MDSRRDGQFGDHAIELKFDVATSFYFILDLKDRSLSR